MQGLCRGSPSSSLIARGIGNGVFPRVGQFFKEFCDTRFVRHGGEGISGIFCRLGGIAAALAVHLVKRLGLGVIGGKVAILQRPFGRDAALVFDSLKVAFAQAKHRTAVDLGVAADIIAGAGTKFLSVLVPPQLCRVVALFLKHLGRIPVLLLARDEAASFQNKDSLSARGKTAGNRASARACANDDEVVSGFVHAKRKRAPRSLLFHFAAVTLGLLAFSSGEGRAANVEISSILLTVSDLGRSRAFFSDVLEFKFVSEKHEKTRTVDIMRLGEETVLLSAPSLVGRPVPEDMPSNDRLFEHLAIVVSNMDSAYARLRQYGTSIISTAPQTLPAWNFDAANIRAVYFRDPDRHFLELIQFPSDKGQPKWHRREGPLFLGIDHTAIVVRDMKTSRHFYRDLLGLTIEGESFNYGPTQVALSGVPQARVKITSLRGVKGPGIELLQYVAPETTNTFTGQSRRE